MSTGTNVETASALVDLLAVLRDEPGSPLRDLAYERLGAQPLSMTRVDGLWQVDVSAFLVPSVLLLDSLVEALETRAHLSRQQALECLRDRIDEMRVS